MDGSNAIRGLFVDWSRAVRGLFVGCSRGLHKPVLEIWLKLCVRFIVCSWKIRKLFASCSKAIRGCSRTVRRTSWAWANPWDQMKQSRTKLLGHKTCNKKHGGIKPVEPKPVRHDFIRQKLKENFSSEQPLAKTSGTEAVGQDPRNRTEGQNRVGEKLKAKPLGGTFGLSLKR